MFTSFENKRVLLGVTGGIAAYKSAELVRGLKKAGASVRVVMTPSAKAFITPLTLQALSGEEVREAMFDKAAEAAMGHIELARWADLILIAPASANCLAELAQGGAYTLLGTICLASQAPIVLCPAMNMHMWGKALVQRNVQRLLKYGFRILGPAEGEQACGDVGMGRMLSPQDILNSLLTKSPLMTIDKPLDGQRLLLTMGPTREYLDPVRYISNESSGHMGYAIALAAAQAGADVTVVAGPTRFTFPPSIKMLAATSAKEMFKTVLKEACDNDIFIAAAAVCDYCPVQASSKKIKKKDEILSLKLVKTPDIVAHVAKHQLIPFVVGFAAETHNIEHYALQKMKAKGLDMVVANQVGVPGSGFNSPTNKAVIYTSGGECYPFDNMPKEELAGHLIRLISTQLRSK